MLIVDDDPAMLDSLREILEDGGYEVVLAANGEEALARLRARPDAAAVLLDLMMPVMNGLECLAAKARDPAILAVPVVLMTAHPIEVRQIVGVTAIYDKPFKPGMLLEALGRICASRG